MVEYGEKARQIAEGTDLDHLLDDDLRRMALERAMEVFGEAAGRVPAFVRRDIDIPWARIVGLRNVLIHAYDRVDTPRLLAAVQDDVPGVVERVRAFLQGAD